MARISHKLRNSFEGALAGGGDPATSPLYVFGPFLSLIMVSGAASVVFGGSIWLAVLTIAVVSAMYRLVMQWVTDGSGGSGLSEEEFGGWAVKVNAAITFVEYTLTFLVSMAAMVTFIADRLPALNGLIVGIQYRTFVAIGLSLIIGFLVNRGPKMAARAFGPATAGVLILLWIMIIATLIRTGFHLPEFSFQAFAPPNLKFTIGGFVRILAVMTGIEVFANLVAAFGGTPIQKSSESFQELAHHYDNHRNHNANCWSCHLHDVQPGRCAGVSIHPNNGQVASCSASLPGVNNWNICVDVRCGCERPGLAKPCSWSQGTALHSSCLRRVE